MISKELLKDYANKLMFDMDDSEYETLLKEFDVILQQMDIIANIENIKNVEPMTFPFELDNVTLRNDNNIRTITTEEALKNSDSKQGNEIKVPKVVE